MNEQEIESFYNHFKNCISAINKAEDKLLKCSYSFEKWNESLKEKSDIIRQYYAENEILIKKLQSISVSELTKEEADKLITHIDFFMSEGFRDYQVVVTVLNVLIDFYSENGPAYRLFDCYYFMGSELLEVHEYAKACEYYRLALDIYKNPYKCEEDYRQFRIMCCYYYRFLAASFDDTINQRILCEYQKTAIEIWVNRPIVSFLSDKKKRAIENILHRLPCTAINRFLNDNITVRNELMENVEREYNIQKELYGDELEIDNAIYVTHHRIRKHYNDITKGEYNRYICKKYEHEKVKEEKFTYGKKDFLALFDDEVTDEEFDVNDLFFMNRSYTYMNYIIPEMISIFRRNDFLDEIEKYYAYMPIVRGDHLLDFRIASHITKIFKYTTDYKDVVRIIDKIFANRQVVTLIHSEMVSRLAVIITNRLIKIAPHLFVGQFGIKAPEYVFSHRDEIIDYIERSAKVHDLGKIMCADIINLQARKISDAEFAIIKKHPEKGAEILDTIPSLMDVREVALGHHKSYDGLFGYPNSFDNTEANHKIFIDIIKLCDCVDAATDYLGRNYAKAKEFSVVLKELIDGKGSVYSDVLVDIIAKDDLIVRDIEKLTKQERNHTYYEVYHNIIEPEVDFRPADEKFVRPFRNEDIETIISMMGTDEVKFMEILAECKEKAYVLTDGNENLFGIALVSDLDEIVEIKNIFVDKKIRRKGNGSLLISEVVRLAAVQGYKKVAMPLTTKGHNDIFGWRNGFVVNELTNRMERTIE